MESPLVMTETKQWAEIEKVRALPHKKEI